MECKPSGPENAKILIVGEAPGENEERAGEPFVGYSGKELDQMLHEAGILRKACRLTNVCRHRPPGNDIGKFMSFKKTQPAPDYTWINDAWCNPEVAQGYLDLMEEIETLKPNLIIALGNTPLWALTGKTGIRKWRGSMLEFTTRSGHVCKLIPTYHPAAVLRQYELRPITVHDLRRCFREANSNIYTNKPNYKFHTSPTKETALDVIRHLTQACNVGPTHVACDIETRAGHISCIGIAWSASEALCIPLMEVGKPEGYWDNPDDEAEIMFALYQLLTHPNCEISGQNFTYDTQYFQRFLLYAPNLKHDTMVAQHACFSTMPKGLDFLASMYCDWYVYWKDEGKDWNPKIHSETQHWEYNCQDCVYTFQIREAEIATIEKMRLQSVNKFQQDMHWILLDMMNRGVRIREEVRDQLRETYTNRMTFLMQKIEFVVGHPFNPRSAPAMAKFFYEDLAVKKVTKRGTGATTCDEKALEIISKREPLLAELIKMITEYRSCGTVLSTFINCELDDDERLRCQYKVTGTNTYRLASSANAFGSGMNMQNLPEEVRTMIGPDEGYTFADLDLDSADLRIVVAESGCAFLQEILDAGEKPYLVLAREYFKDESIGKDSPYYKVFKSFAHGTHYLGTPAGLAYNLKLAEPAVIKLQKWYFAKCPEIPKWQERFTARVRGRRIVENIFGYYLRILQRIEGNVMNEAIAWLPQSTIGILINKIAERIFREEPRIQLLMQTHDSLGFQYPTALESEIKPRIAELSKIELPYPRPIIIPTGLKTSTVSYGDCK